MDTPKGLNVDSFRYGMRVGPKADKRQMTILGASPLQLTVSSQWRYSDGGRSRGSEPQMR